MMGKKLYVGNLSYQVDSSELEQLFGQHGTVVSAQIINDRDTGRSKGFGFVEMGTDDEAQAAIAALNGQEHGGRDRYSIAFAGFKSITKPPSLTGVSFGTRAVFLFE